jgi:hypothetical protein
MLKFVVSPIIGLFAYILIAVLDITLIEPDRTRMSSEAFVVGIIAGVIATIVTFKSFPKKSIKESVADSFSFVKDTTNEVSSMVSDDDSEFYAKAEEEIIDGVVNKGLWSQALVAADGDETKRKIEYMKLRVKQLKRR